MKCFLLIDPPITWVRSSRVNVPQISPRHISFKQKKSFPTAALQKGGMKQNEDKYLKGKNKFERGIDKFSYYPDPAVISSMGTRYNKNTP